MVIQRIQCSNIEAGRQGSEIAEEQSQEGSLSMNSQRNYD